MKHNANEPQSDEPEQRSAALLPRSELRLTAAPRSTRCGWTPRGPAARSRPSSWWPYAAAVVSLKQEPTNGTPLEFGNGLDDDDCRGAQGGVQRRRSGSRRATITSHVPERRVVGPSVVDAQVIRRADGETTREDKPSALEEAVQERFTVGVPAGEEVHLQRSVSAQSRPAPHK
jgi:hypothetical protein